jgi:hypothetical protein
MSALAPSPGVLGKYNTGVTEACHPVSVAGKDIVGTIAKKLKLSRTTVKKYLRILLNHCLIAISHRMSQAGDPTSNSYMILDPSPEQVALRKRKLEALLTPQHGTFKVDGGGSPDGRPPCPSATDPRSPDDPKQVFLLNKRERTSETLLSLPTEKQKTCQHPQEEIARLSENIIICNHCFALLDDYPLLATITLPRSQDRPSGSNGEILGAKVFEDRASAECDPDLSGEPETKQPPVGAPAKTAPVTPLKMAHKSCQIAPGEQESTKKTHSLVVIGKLILGRLKSS